MKSIRDLNKPPQIEGRVEAIVVRGSPRDAARTVATTVALAGIGLADDRLGQRGEAELSTRQVTLIQVEHLDVIARLARVDVVDPVGLRRNLVISGINLLALKNARLQVGGAVLEVAAAGLRAGREPVWSRIHPGLVHDPVSPMEPSPPSLDRGGWQ